MTQQYNRKRDEVRVDDCVTIVDNIVSYARNIFAECEAESDFCIQYVGYETMTFGGTNRLIWSVTHGFRIDEGYCTARFRNLYHGVKDA